MSDDDSAVPRWVIEPEPTPAELVAILIAMQPTAAKPVDTTQQSNWLEAARLEQMRHPLDERRTGWNR